MKKLWSYFDGKKTVIGILMHAGWLAANIVFKDMANVNEVLVGHSLIFSITGVGIGHKINKAIKDGTRK